MGTITLTTARTGSGPSSTIVITSGDTTNAKPFVAGPINPTCESDLRGIKEAVWGEICRQMQAL